jgi:hypothetical protein
MEEMAAAQPPTADDEHFQAKKGRQVVKHLILQKHLEGN